MSIPKQIIWYFGRPGRSSLFSISMSPIPTFLLLNFFIWFACYPPHQTQTTMVWMNRFNNLNPRVRNNLIETSFLRLKMLEIWLRNHHRFLIATELSSLFEQPLILRTSCHKHFLKTSFYILSVRVYYIRAYLCSVWGIYMRLYHLNYTQRHTQHTQLWNMTLE